jgi:hypothetical protein
MASAPGICVDAAFATIQSDLILARLVRRYDFEVIAPNHVNPVAWLTTRPAKQIIMRNETAAVWPSSPRRILLDDRTRAYRTGGA